MLLQNICTCCKIDTAGLSSYNLRKKNCKLYELADKYFHPLKKVVLWSKSMAIVHLRHQEPQNLSELKETAAKSSNFLENNQKTTYRIVASTSPSRFEAHAGLFRLVMKGIFDMHCKVASSRLVYYSILNSFGQRSQYISSKFPVHKQSENPWMCY